MSFAMKKPFLREVRGIKGGGEKHTWRFLPISKMMFLLGARSSIFSAGSYL